MKPDNIKLKSQSVHGAIWTFLDILVNKGTYFIATMILARLLGPKEFGIMGMIAVFVAIGNTLIDSGMSTSLIRTKNPTEQDYSTVFFTNVVMSLIVYALLFFLAPLISDFYHEFILTKIIRLYCLGFILSSLRGVHQVRLIKTMNFKKISILNLPGNIIAVVVSIWMGKHGFGVWSLVFLFLINQLIASISYWIFIDWNPRLSLNISNYKYHFKFGYKLVLSAQLNTLFENIYNLIIGKFYSVQMLGYYERAYTLNNYPVSILSGIVQKVSLHPLTQIKDDSLRLHNAYKSIMQIAFLISAAGLGFAATVARPLIELLLGEQWLPIVPLFQILCIAYVFYPIHSLNIDILSVFGRSDLFLRLEVVKKIMIVCVVAVCFNFGILGLVWSSVITSLFALLINSHYSGKFLKYPMASQIKDLIPTLTVVCAVLIPIHLLQSMIRLNLVLSLFLFFIVFVVMLTLLGELLKLSPYLKVKQIIKEQVKQ